MVGARCESPRTMRAIARWHDALLDCRILLRDVIDLDATYGGGPDATDIKHEEDGTAEAAAAKKETRKDDRNGAGKDAADGAAGDGAVRSGEADEEEGEDEEASLSLAAMEAALKPQVLETFENIASTYKRLPRAQDKRIATLQKGEEVSKSTERTYERYKRDLVELMETVRLNNLRIEQLVHQDRKSVV